VVRSWLERRKARNRDATGEHLETALESDSAVWEAYRTLRANLLHSFGSTPPGVIVLTSPGPRKDGSIACANLAAALVNVNKRVLVLDCDLRKPVVHKLFGLRNVYGLTDVLEERTRLEDAWQDPLPGMKVLTAGAVPPGAVDLLESSNFDDLLGRVRREFDYVLVDAPPLDAVSDATVLATRCDGVLLLLDARDRRKEPVRRAMQELKVVEANVLGTVLLDAHNRE
jgi:capsular exopolysaccharide synthesis family protein